MANSTSSARVLQSRAKARQAAAEPSSAGHGPFEEASRLLPRPSSLEAQPSAAGSDTSPPMIGPRPGTRSPPSRSTCRASNAAAVRRSHRAAQAHRGSVRAVRSLPRARSRFGAADRRASRAFDGYMGFLRYLFEQRIRRPCKHHIHFYDGVSDGQLKTLYEAQLGLRHDERARRFLRAGRRGHGLRQAGLRVSPTRRCSETLGRSGRVFYSKDFDAIAADLRAVLTTAWKQRADRRRSSASGCNRSSSRPTAARFGPRWKRCMYGARAV